MIKELVSIIVPVYNRESFLNNCLQSLAHQSYENIEIIVVDDCSKDSSFQIAERFSKSDKRFKVFRNEKNRGVSFSRNYAITKAQGEYIALMDSDDISLRERISLQVKELKNAPIIGVLGTSTILKSKNGFSEIVSYPVNNKEIYIKLLQDFPFCNSSLMFRRSCFDGMKAIYNEKLKTAEDFELLVRLKLQGVVFSNIHQVLVERNIHTESLTYTEFGDLELVRKQIISTQLEDLGTFGIKLAEYIYVSTYKSKPNTQEVLDFLCFSKILNLNKKNKRYINIYGKYEWQNFLFNIEHFFMKHITVKLSVSKRLYLVFWSNLIFMKYYFFNRLGSFDNLE